MNVEAFLLCDAATDSAGKLNILGAFDTINSPNFPTMHPQCYIVVRLRLQRIESGSHQVTIHIIDDDGKFVVPALDGNFTVEIPASDRSGNVNIILNLQGLKFDHAGEYAVILAIDGKEAARLPLHLKQM